MNNLALGIPTYKRPALAIGAIRRALAVNIYDQIIVSANSYEPELEAFIESSGAPFLPARQQNQTHPMVLPKNTYNNH